MNNYRAGWRMPTRKQMEDAARVGRNAPLAPAFGPADDMPQEYWDSLLRDAGADVRPGANVRATQTLSLSDIPQHLLRVTCRRCERIVEIQKLDAIRLYGPKAVWKDVGLRLLDNTCQQRTGSHEEDGCWPSY